MADGVQTGRNLYNGNIRAMVVNIPQLGNAGVYGYRYDQLNRIKAMNSFSGFANATNTLTAAAVLDYRERISYDPNGNIKTYNRSGNAARLSMGDMTYTYKTTNNQLDRVADAATDAGTAQYPDYNDIKQGQAAGNYQYDAIGNLISDAAEGITNIIWTVYGKIDSITKSATNTTIKYGYDASGNRISKAVKVGSTTTNTIYVRDASGNTMAVYTKDAAINSGAFTQTEISLYGSSRLGVWNINRNLTTLTSIDYSNYKGSFTRGNKLFELANHLGNVLVTVSDKKIGVDVAPQNGIIDYCVAEVVTAIDYYSFGMTMPGRKYEQPNSNYRYGFNGKEQDKETTGTSTYDYGFRIYSPALGRFLSVDPLSQSYPYNSPYAFAENRVIDGVDLEGLEYATVIYKYYYGSDKPKIETVWHNNLQHNTFGNLGRGVAVKSQHYDQNGKIASESATLMFRRIAQNLIAKEDYGFYYGPTQLKQVDVVNTYQLKAIDAVDEAGRIHDRAYDFVRANATNATQSWGSIEADEGIIAASSNVLKLGVGAVDPFDNEGNKQKITLAEYSAAGNAKDYFKLSQWNKIEAVSYWMEKNYKTESKEGSGFFNDNEQNQRSNYNLFRSKYMHQNTEGIWIENDGMWKTVGGKIGEGKKGYRAPLTPNELKTK